MATKKAAKKSTTKKASTRKTATKKSATKKAAVRNAPAKKSAVKKSTAKKATKKAAKKSSTRKYSPSTGSDVKREMHAMHQGKLKSGRSGKKVTNPKQAIAIALSEARKEGKKVPAKKR